MCLIRLSRYKECDCPYGLDSLGASIFDAPCGMSIMITIRKPLPRFSMWITTIQTPPTGTVPNLPEWNAMTDSELPVFRHTSDIEITIHHQSPFHDERELSEVQDLPLLQAFRRYVGVHPGIQTHGTRGHMRKVQARMLRELHLVQQGDMHEDRSGDVLPRCLFRLRPLRLRLRSYPSCWTGRS